MSEDKLDGIPPLGKSAEEVEREESNRVNPGALGGRADGQATPAPVPVLNPGAAGMPGNLTAGGAPIVGPLALGGLLRDPAIPPEPGESPVSEEDEA